MSLSKPLMYDIFENHDKVPSTGSGTEKGSINQEGLFVMVAVFLVVEPVETTEL